MLSIPNNIPKISVKVKVSLNITTPAVTARPTFATLYTTTLLDSGAYFNDNPHKIPVVHRSNNPIKILLLFPDIAHFLRKISLAVSATIVKLSKVMNALDNM